MEFTLSPLYYPLETGIDGGIAEVIAHVQLLWEERRIGDNPSQ